MMTMMKPLKNFLILNNLNKFILITHNIGMKKFVAFCLICVIFILLPNGSIVASAANSSTIEFFYNGKIFTYCLDENIKTSDIFNINYELNKFNRFGSIEERQKLLKHLIDIGLNKQIAIEYLFPNLTKLVEKINKNISVQPKNAKVIINSNLNQAFKVTPEVVGISLNTPLIYDMIYKNYINNKPLKINLPIIKTQPQILKKDIIKYTNLRADFSTDISSSNKDRKHNIKNALVKLNKLEILPNEIFSFNKVIGARTQENGYRQAKIIVNNEFVEGFGGGVCQVSSTLYNAALLSGLEILEANKHSKQVFYVKKGFDAMVNFGSSDLKFKNNTNEKITIITNFSNTTLRIRIYGETLNGTQYKLTNEIFNIVEPSEEIQYDTNNEHLDKVIYEDEFFYFKTATTGMEINSYREKYENGVLINKEFLRKDKYRVQNAIKMYGTKKRMEDPYALIL